MSALVTASLLAGCGFVDAADRDRKPDGFAVRGYVSVAGVPAGAAGAACRAPSAVRGIAEGSLVRVADVRGEALASGPVGGGVLASTTPGQYRCNFPFEILNVPGGRDVYVLVVADQPAASFPVQGIREGAAAIIEVPAVSPAPS